MKILHTAIRQFRHNTGISSLMTRLRKGSVQVSDIDEIVRQLQECNEALREELGKFEEVAVRCRAGVWDNPHKLAFEKGGKKALKALDYGTPLYIWT